MLDRDAHAARGCGTSLLYSRAYAVWILHYLHSVCGYVGHRIKRGSLRELRDGGMPSQGSARAPLPRLADEGAGLARDACGC